MNNQELRRVLIRIAEKDNAAFDDLYKGYSKVIFGIALSLIKNEESCNDVVQLVMSKLFTMPKENFPTSHELTWLYAVTKNEALQLLRKEHLHIPLDDVFNMESITDELSNTIDMDAYRDMIKSLDEKSKTIVTLKVIAGFSHKEIGKLLHMPIGTVQWKYHAAIHKLRIVIANLSLFVVSLLYTVQCYIEFKEPKSEGSVGLPLTTLPIGFILLCIITGLLGVSLALVLKKVIKKH